MQRGLNLPLSDRPTDRQTQHACLLDTEMSGSKKKKPFFLGGREEKLSTEREREKEREEIVFHVGLFEPLFCGLAGKRSDVNLRARLKVPLERERKRIYHHC